ncbi:MAG: zinc-ribbon domain-containing protein [Chloroflexi bacterium]|nr:zinc-ribbon domain-containing protein [Chloroflexota bacterium]
MSDFVESAKNFVNAAVSRTSWEAQKQLRLRGKQGEIDKLVEQRQQLLGELGQVAMNLYQQGALTDTQLSRLCASIFELDHDMKNRETQLQEIKNEAYPADQFAPAPTTNYTPPPASPSPSAQGPRTQPGPASQPQSGPQPGPRPGAASQPQPGSQPGATSQAQPYCPHCGNPLRPNALYCRSCGAKLR